MSRSSKHWRVFTIGCRSLSHRKGGAGPPGSDACRRGPESSMRVRIRLSGWSGCRCRFRPSFSAMCSGTLFDGCGDSASLARAEEAEEEAEEGVEKEEVGVEKEEEEVLKTVARGSDSRGGDYRYRALAGSPLQR